MVSKIILIYPNGKKRVITCVYNANDLMNLLHIDAKYIPFKYAILNVDAYSYPVLESFTDSDGNTQSRTVTHYCLDESEIPDQSYKLGLPDDLNSDEV